MIGTKLAHYEITSHLGTGGMGEVYQATDSKLGRSVAIKLLPQAFIHDTERVARFEREARLLASLNHPNIAVIYGIEESNGRKFLVMELVPGETLAQRINRGPVPIDEALAIARKIAEALEAAHEKGMIHRDLKPANIKITPEGTMKLLDFGLAKAYDVELSQGSSLSNSPTISAAATRQGVILGTAAYMAPEQARGRAVDKRADVWAFGCVLFESLTGRAAFHGEDLSEVLASVLKSEPDWDRLPANLNPRLQELLHRCLQKDMKKRYRDIGDVRMDIEVILSEPARLVAPASNLVSGGTRSKLPWVAAIVLAMLFGVVVWYVRPAPAPAPRPVIRFVHEVPRSQGLDFGQNAFAVSPSGDQFVYAAADGLYLCRMNELEARHISGTDGERAEAPFFSPDSEWVGYYSAGQLKKVRTTGGTPVFLAKVDTSLFDPSWSANGRILYVQQPQIMMVLATGGTPSVLVDVGERVVGPRLLPDGDSLLFTVGSADRRKVMLRSLSSGKQKPLFDDADTGVEYLASGHLVYGSGSDVSVRAFDDRTKKVGMPVSLVQNFFRRFSLSAPQFRVSESGTLVYLPGTPNQGSEFSKQLGRESLALFDHEGKPEALPPEALPPEASDYAYPRFSPDDKRVAVQIDRNGASNIWIYEIADKLLTQLTFDGGTAPLWSPDGKEVTFLRDNAIWTVESNFRGSPTLLPGTQAAGNRGPGAWSLDKADLLFASDAGIHVWQRKNTAKAAEVIVPARGGVKTIFPEFSAADSHWFVYSQVAQSGDTDLYVSPYPVSSGAPRRITTDGGFYPVWVQKLQEIIFASPITQETTINGRGRGGRGPDRRMSIFALPITTDEPTFTRRNSVKLPLLLTSAILNAGGVRGVRGGERPYDVSHDGQHFIVVRTAVETALSVGARPDSTEIASEPLRIHVVVNWFEEIRARIPPP